MFFIEISDQGHYIYLNMNDFFVTYLNNWHFRKTL